MSEVKNIVKRFLSLTLIFAMVAAMLPAVSMPVNAATSGTVTGLADGNIGLSFSGDADDAWSANGATITGSATSISGTCSDTHYNSTLTITNNKSTTATLSFDYVIEQNSGTIQIDGTPVTSGGSFSKDLEAGKSIKIYIKSGSTTATKITMTNVALVSNVVATATFIPAENGSYTVDGEDITAEYSNTQSSLTAYQVAATSGEGYKFLGWYDVTNGRYISTSAKASLNIESDCTITAKFASKTAAIFETGGQSFADLNEAAAYALSNGQNKITLTSDGTISGDYTIPSGITLLIPFDEAGTLYTDTPAAIRTAPASKPFRTLTMSKGSAITVNGSISVGGRYFAAGGGQQGSCVGDYGYIKMNAGSSINVNSGGNLYAWGFISGDGSVVAERGSTVHEWYQIMDFRGGTATMGMGNKVFPFSQYSVQNIESSLTLEQGASEIVYAAVFARSTINYSSIEFIGDKGLFKIAGGSLNKRYDGTTDRMVYTINGAAELNNLNLSLAGSSVSSKNYVLPVTNNMTINISEGSTLTVKQDTALLAGTVTNIAQDAGLIINSTVYVYDRQSWMDKKYACNWKFCSVPYAPSKTYTRKDADITDAKIDVNGSITVKGALYTTKNGADICSSDCNGIYNQASNPGKEAKTYQYTQSGSSVTRHEIPITPAKLHKGDSYIETVTAKAGDKIQWDHTWSKTWTSGSDGHWKKCEICETNGEILSHEAMAFGEVGATCTNGGYEAGSKCEICGYIILEPKAIIAAGHKLTKTEAKAATCTEAGNKAYYTCSGCKKYFSDAAGENEIAKDSWIIAAGHHWKTGWTVDKEATCKEEGSKSHHCKNCDAKTDVTVIPTMAHNYQNGKCTYCGEVKHTSSSGNSRDYVTNVNTDDAKTTVANIIPRNNGKLNISDAVLKEIFSKAAANSSTKVVIRVHHKYTNSSSVYQINLSQDMIDNLIKDNKYELVINTGQGEFTLNAEILKTMSAKAADGISVTSRELDQSEMNKKQKAACGEYGSIIQLIATDSKGEIIWSGNGAHTAAVEIPDKLAGKDVKILVIDKYGLYRELDSSIVEQNGKKYLSFSSDGAARYIITDSDNAVSLLDKQAQRLKKPEKGVKKTKLKLNVSVTSKGNMKLTWKKSKGYNVDYYQVYRAVKKKGFGKKAFYQNSSDIRKYINTKNLKQGKRYYYKVRGVRLVGDKLVYTGWSNIDSEIAD